MLDPLYTTVFCTIVTETRKMENATGDNALFTQALDRLKESFLWAAAQGGNLQDCESLLEIGAEVNWKGTGGDTPLLAACRRGHSDVVAALLAKGADANIRGNDEMTPLLVASKRGDFSSLNLLLECHADVNAKTKDGLTSMDIARAKCYEDIVARLDGNHTSSLTRRRPADGVKNDWPLVNGTNSNNTSNSQPLPRIGSRGSSGMITPLNTSSVVNLPQVSPRGGSGGGRVGGRNNSANSTDWVGNQSTTSNTSSMAEQYHLIHNLATSQQQSQMNLVDNSNEVAVNENFTASAMSSTKQPSSASNSSIGSNKLNNNTAAAKSSSVSSVSDTEVITYYLTEINTLKKLLDCETETRHLAEQKCKSAQEQSLFLTNELSEALHEVSLVLKMKERFELELLRIRGDPNEMAKLQSVQECEQLENVLRKALESVEKRKATIIQEELGNHKEQRLCVVCQEKEKSVVLLPCRHLCLCETCSSLNQIEQCPLCRRPIAHRIGVYS